MWLSKCVAKIQNLQSSCGVPTNYIICVIYLYILLIFRLFVYNNNLSWVLKKKKFNTSSFSTNIFKILSITQYLIF